MKQQYCLVSLFELLAFLLGITPPPGCTYLEGIKGEYDNTIRTNGFHDLVVQAKRGVEERQLRILPPCVLGRRYRQVVEETEVPLEVQIKRHYSRDLRFLGNAGFQARRDQLEYLHRRHMDRLDRGTLHTMAPCPPTVELFSPQYTTWFMGAKPGVLIYRVANASGRKPNA
ncbi:uncharacterized protein BYT42DRAFT_386536 [Radiomyces spectabilis]|uniref:uncharacterized protein n=1 Tax=Radiomyces spectabilis TaxID=64574 RepID=UPI0022203041|nr:uncharacterized protein BYT42DRAFT_386536 [Radiomyces spectabilis]KAI8376437.1 hypothetical protein BYT42DRAFT_386536 [Radiomyces spectabilis]